MENYQSFGSCVLDWWNEYVNENYDNHDMWGVEMMEALGYTPVADYLDEEEEETPYEFLINVDDSERIYHTFFGYDCKNKDNWDNMPDTYGLLENIFRSAVGDRTLEDYGFAEDFIKDMAYNAEGYKNPKGFFEDLQRGGCQSGMIGMLIYNDDCRKLYIDNIDDMENYKEEFEEELGSSVKNDKRLPHYTFMCWFCYEELAYRIYSTLFEQ